MKHNKFLLTLLALILVGLNMSCSSSNPDSSYTGSSTPSPTPVVSPTPASPRSGNLVEATSNREVSCQFSGAGNAAKMNLTVRNETETVWELKIEVGTKLEPSEGDVQQMVITKEYEIELEPHEEEKLVVEVSCLDINKDPPATENKAWGIKMSQQLAQFISCANAGIDELERKGQAKKEDRHGLLQFAIWKARGATRDDFIHLITTNSETAITEEEASASLDEDEPLIIEAISGCKSLVNLG